MIYYERKAPVALDKQHLRLDGVSFEIFFNRKINVYITHEYLKISSNVDNDRLGIIIGNVLIKTLPVY